MPRGQPNQVSAPYVIRPMGEAVRGGVTRGEGRIENNE